MTEIDAAVGSSARRPKRWHIVLMLVLVFAAVTGALMLFSSPPAVGLVDGRLRPCPKSPNCVCSQDSDLGHAVEPLRFNGSSQVAWERLRDAVTRLPRAAIVSRDELYLHAEFTTPLMRYVDDVEFVLDEAQSAIHVRSASRIGYSDLGANRKRVEAIRQLLATALQSPPASGQATRLAE